MAQEKSHNKTVYKLLFAVIGMFAFGFALVPLYDVFCEITGINGKTQGRYEVTDAKVLEVDESREVRVQFITHNNENMPWEFRPVVAEIKVHPGELTSVDFYAKNTTSRTMTAQAVPSLSPSRGVDYFHKTECFCFNQQKLEAQEEVLMPLRFVVDKALPDELKVLTLSYTLFDQKNPDQASSGELPMTFTINEQSVATR
ncbi:MAG: cytochrome c oxidase assembly protein [Oleiphilus sp.]|nr:MAG: cytochrome c oxidase assembly protein [Oleiphilus sp.]